MKITAINKQSRQTPVYTPTLFEHWKRDNADMIWKKKKQLGTQDDFDMVARKLYFSMLTREERKKIWKAEDQEKEVEKAIAVTAITTAITKTASRYDGYSDVELKQLINHFLKIYSIAKVDLIQILNFIGSRKSLIKPLPHQERVNEFNIEG